MRAVLMERGRLWVEDIEPPVPGPGEILVKTLACGICGSDLHAAQHTQSFVETSRAAGGAFKLTTYDPVVLGHEFCAEVVESGPATSGRFSPGQRVCSVPMLARQPMQAVGYSDEIPGGFAEYMVLSEALMTAVPEGTPVQAAALTEPLAVGFHAVNKARLDGGEAALVIGAGPVGLAVITALKARGIGPIIAADYSPGRRNFALEQGADAVVDPALEHPFHAPGLARRELVVFECVGVPGVLDDIFMHAPAHTRIVVVGVCLQTDHIRPLIAINKELSLQFVLGYSMEEFTASLARIADGRFDVSGLVSHTVGLQEVPQMFESLKDPEQFAKVMVDPWA